MSGADDVPGEMTRREIDDAAAERLLGESAATGQEPLGLLLSQLRSMSSRTPEPSTALAALLRDGFPAAPAAAAAPEPETSRWGRRLAAVAGMSLAVKVLAGTGVAVAAVGTAAGAGVLPEPVRDGVSSVVRTLTPFDLDDPEQAPPPATPARPAPVQATTPTLPTPAPMQAPARGTSPQDLPTGGAGTRSERPAPAPVAPGAERRPDAPRTEQRPQQRSATSPRPAERREEPPRGRSESRRSPSPDAAPRRTAGPGTRVQTATPALPPDPVGSARAAGRPGR